MSSKVKYGAMLSTGYAGATKQGFILKRFKADTFSAINPAYLFTSQCPDLKRRKPPASKKVRHEAFR